MIRNGIVSVGQYMIANRKDGREFAGVVDSVKILPKGTFVVMMVQTHDIENYGVAYHSFYLENLTNWEIYADREELNIGLASLA